MRTRIRNLIKKLAEGAELYTNYSPQITRGEIEEIEQLVDLLQIESIHGAESGSPRAVYPLRRKIFRAKAKELEARETE